MTTATHCSRCESPLEPEDLRCAVCGLPTPPAPRAEVADHVARILRCHGCGAAVSYKAEVGHPKCDFCGSVMELEVPDDPIEEASAYLHFSVDEAVARQALRSWLGKQGFFRPPDLQTQATVDALKPLWWVGWMFDAEVKVHWAADSDAGARRSSWAPHSGQCELRLQRVVSASRGLTQHECTALIPHYAIQRADASPPSNTTATIETFAVQRSGARAIIAQALEATAASEAAKRIPGSTYRNLHVAVLPTRLTSERFAFPAYVLAYRYRDRVYRAIVHGQDARCVVGTAPISWARVAMVIGIVLAVLVLVVVLIKASA